MTAIDRYLKRVTFWLPRRQRSDVTAELRDVLLDKLEAVQTARGRPLTAAEEHAILREFGHPAMVVSRYLERRPVISAGLTFFFWRVLAIALIAILVAQSLVLAIEASHAASLWPVIDHGARRTLLALLLGFTCVTASFMIIERRYGG